MGIEAGVAAESLPLSELVDFDTTELPAQLGAQ
jgi:hypothetical protein